MPTFRRLLRDGTTLLTVDAATGSGKTRVCPQEAQQAVGGKLLLIARSTLDVVRLHKETRLPSCYRMGGGRQDGVAMGEAKMVIATAGLATAGLVESTHGCRASGVESTTGGSSTNTHRLTPLPVLRVTSPTDRDADSCADNRYE